MIKICSNCNCQFETKTAEKYCSDPCRKTAYSKLKSIYSKKYEKQRSKRSRSNAVKPIELKRKKKPEKVMVENMLELNRNVKNDRERIKAKGITSPDLSKIEYKHYDPAMRATRFFRNKERYELFLETLNTQS